MTENEIMFKDYLLDILTYDPETGLVHRKNNPTKRLGRQKTTFYLQHTFCHPQTKKVADFTIHRVAWLLHTGQWPEQTIDHINGDPTDNRISNLQDISLQDNKDKRVFMCPEKRKKEWMSMIYKDI